MTADLASMPDFKAMKRRFGFVLGGARASRLLRVQAIGLDLYECSHKEGVRGQKS